MHSLPRQGDGDIVTVERGLTPDAFGTQNEVCRGSGHIDACLTRTSGHAGLWPLLSRRRRLSGGEGLRPGLLRVAGPR